ESLQRQIDQLKAAMERMQRAPAPPPPAPVPAHPPQVTTAPPVQAESKDLIFNVGGGHVQIYGHVDVSLDSQTNGMSGFLNGGEPVTGKNGWVADISSNLSYFGVRGDRRLTHDLTGLFQFETEVAYAATPGASDQAPDTTAQKYELGSRNSFVGMRSDAFGAI